MTQPSFHIPDSLIETTNRRGDAQMRWLERLPQAVERAAARWSLRLQGPFADLSYNYVAPATLPDGTPAVLKLCFPDPDGDFLHEEAATRAFGGHKSVKLIDSDLEESALLLERLEPGTMLHDLGDDVAETSIAASVMRGLWSSPGTTPPAHEFPRAGDWIDEASRPSAIPGRKQSLSWIDGALARTRERAAATVQPLLLHGDLHHYNILAAQREPWLAIDPHGVIGHPAWELAPFLINNLERFPRHDWPSVIRRRADQLSEELSLDREDVYAWNATRALQCAFWSLRDDTRTWDAAVVCAQEMAKGVNGA
jgi:streptomycin 6-kinase